MSAQAVIGSARGWRGLSPRSDARGAGEGPVCVAVGDINLVRALSAGRIPCATFSPPEDPSRFSRHVRVALEWVDPETDPSAFVDRLVEFADAQASAPVVMPQTDAALLALSRWRRTLETRVRMSLARSELVEALVDKAMFARLAERLGLAVPRTVVLSRDGDTPPQLAYPVIVKPFTRSGAWEDLAQGAKAVRVSRAAQLAQLCERLPAGVGVLAQEEIAGPESRIESYHVYVDATGDVVAEFTGRKIRTLPPRLGFSTAVEITDADDVRAVGRRAVERLKLTGVAKLDFKRAPDGRLWLLEVNPRFNLWHHPGALAGVNLPALVYADLVGLPRPAVRTPRAGVRWCQPLQDLAASRASGEPVWRWALWFARCEARSTLSLRDPRPLVARLVSPIRAPVAAR